MVIEVKVDNASCMLWLDDTPQFETYRTASLGKFECADTESGSALLRQSFKILTEKNIEYVIGPMDQNTWNAYRFVTEVGEYPPFFMEPQNPDFYPDVFTNERFEPIGNFSSAINTDLSIENLDEFAKTLETHNIKIREFDLEDAQSDLEKIYKLSVKSFSQNFLYTPILKDQFSALYTPIIPYLKERYVLLAENNDGELCGFIFAIPNYAQGENPNQLIFKTYASDFKGLGRYLANEMTSRAKKDKFTAVIHALMHDDNASKKSSDYTGKTLRRYTLYGRRIV